MLRKLSAPESFIEPPLPLGSCDSVLPYVYVYFGVSNSGIVITDEGVVIIDAQTSPGAAKNLHDKIRGITDKQIRYVVNTHYHGDHTYGNATWQKLGVPIIGSALTSRFMAIREAKMKMFYRSRGLPSDGIPVVLPTFQFENEFTFDLGGTEFQLKHLGPGETEDSIVVWLPKQKLLFSNDTMHCFGFPIFGQPMTNEGLDGDGKFLDTLTSYSSLGAELVIPGHGHVTDNSSIFKMREIAEFFLKSVNDEIIEEKSFENINSSVLKKVPEEYFRMPPVWGSIDAAIRRAYYSLAGWLPNRPEAIPKISDARSHEILTESGMMDASKAKQRVEELLGARNLDLALQHCEAIIQHVSTDDARIYALKGEVLIDSASELNSLFDRGEYLHAAKKCLDQALLLDQEDPVAKLNLGLLGVSGLLIYGGPPDDLIKIINDCLTYPLSDLRKAKAHYGLALAYQYLKEISLARKNLTQALAIVPDFAEAKDLLNELNNT